MKAEFEALRVRVLREACRRKELVFEPRTVAEAARPGLGRQEELVICDLDEMYFVIVSVHLSLSTPPLLWPPMSSVYLVHETWMSVSCSPSNSLVVHWLPTFCLIWYWRRKKPDERQSCERKQELRGEPRAVLKGQAHH